jgi:hypothetical protein
MSEKLLKECASRDLQTSGVIGEYTDARELIKYITEQIEQLPPDCRDNVRAQVYAQATVSSGPLVFQFYIRVTGYSQVGKSE